MAPWHSVALYFNVNKCVQRKKYGNGVRFKNLKRHQKPVMFCLNTEFSLLSVIKMNKIIKIINKVINVQ